MKKLNFILLILLNISCSQVSKDKVYLTENTDKTELINESIKKDSSHLYKAAAYSNPTSLIHEGVVIDFGKLFQLFYKYQDFEKMINFTSKESIDKFGKETVYDFYKNELDFGYQISFLSRKIDGDTIVMNYNADIMATKKVVIIKIVFENDSCKILLPSELKNFLN
jgi:hypothetical protein